MYLHCTAMDDRNIRISFSKKDPESIGLLKDTSTSTDNKQQNEVVEIKQEPVEQDKQL